METLTKEKNVLQQKDFVGIYEIITCKVDILISTDFKTIRQQILYEVKKIKEGVNGWCVTSRHPSKKITLHSAKDTEGNILSAKWNIIKEALTEIHISFNKEIPVGKTFKFHFDYSQPIDSTIITNTWFSKLYLVNIPKAFGTHCQLISCTIEFESKFIEITKVIPESKVMNYKDKIHYEESLRPFEFFNLSFIVRNGFLGIKVSKNIEKIFWIIISAFVGITLTIIYNKIFAP
jgi:hypothetical protein